jgi:hypothetical protein
VDETVGMVEAFRSSHEFTNTDDLIDSLGDEKIEQSLAQARWMHKTFGEWLPKARAALEGKDNG